MKYKFYRLEGTTLKWKLIKEFNTLPQLEIELFFDSLQKQNRKSHLYKVDEIKDDKATTIMYSPECFRDVTTLRFTEPFYKIMCDLDKLSVENTKDIGLVKKEINKAIRIINNWCFELNQDFWKIVGDTILKEWLFKNSTWTVRNTQWMLYYAMLSSHMLNIYIDTTMCNIESSENKHKNVRIGEIEKTLDIILKYAEPAISQRIKEDFERTKLSFFNKTMFNLEESTRKRKKY